MLLFTYGSKLCTNGDMGQSHTKYTVQTLYLLALSGSNEGTHT